MSGSSNLDPRALVSEGAEVLEREAILLDERRWDEWLALYTSDCEFWMPAWKSDGSLTADPQTELSHFYYGSRAGLEDRIYRIRSNRSPASMPLPRTTHLVSAVRVLDEEAGRLRLRASWVCHVFFPRSEESHAFFGQYEHSLVSVAGGWLIARKRIVLLNDYIPTMLDIFCV